MTTERLRGQRSVFALVPAAAAPAQGRRTIFDCANSTFLPGASIVRTEDGPAASDASANRAFDGPGETRTFYKEVFDRDSLDGRGMRLNAYVHYDNGYSNAFWSGREMVFGDGDGVLFTDFTKSLDVIGHELTHGVAAAHPAGIQRSTSAIGDMPMPRWHLPGGWLRTGTRCGARSRR